MAGRFEITPEQLLKRIGTHDMPALVDLRIDDDFREDPVLIPGSIRIEFKDLDRVIEYIRGRLAVVFCHKGLKISQGVAAQLRARSIQADVLAGGFEAWRDVGGPVVAMSNVSSTKSWVTRQRPKVDRIACPWLIRRFIDPEAEILFVPATDVALVAERFDAIPFDVEGVRFSHVGEACSFDTFLQEFRIQYAPLTKMAEVIRAADTNALDRIPQASGVLAILLGLSRMYRDDYAQLEAGFTICDALFRWAKDAQNESHDWPTPRNR
ncbi:MAG: sulfurtransferase/chromate resistance protein [Pseudomonadota bacterium]